MFRLEYAGGARNVPISISGEEFQNLNSCGFICIRNNQQVKSWCDEALDEKDLQSCNGFTTLIAAIAFELIQEQLENIQDMSFVFRSIYHRNSNTRYTNHVHRDLDETAVLNFRSEGAIKHFNFWVPIKPVKNHTLALLDPSSVSADSVTGFKAGILHDGTGLNWDSGHRWVYFSNLQPGDILIWESSRVYHASFENSNVATPRESIDGRIYLVDHQNI